MNCDSHAKCWQWTSTQSSELSQQEKRTNNHTWPHTAEVLPSVLQSCLLRLVLIPCHVEGELHPWTRSTALSFAAEIDGHVLGTLCAVTMALLTNRLDLCIQGLFGAGKSKSMAILILALIEIDTTDSLKILFICKENSGTRSFADLLLWLDPPVGGVWAHR